MGGCSRVDKEEEEEEEEEEDNDEDDDDDDDESGKVGNNRAEEIFQESMTF